MAYFCQSLDSGLRKPLLPPRGAFPSPLAEPCTRDFTFPPLHHILEIGVNGIFPFLSDRLRLSSFCDPFSKCTMNLVGRAKDFLVPLTRPRPRPCTSMCQPTKTLGSIVDSSSPRKEREREIQHVSKDTDTPHTPTRPTFEQRVDHHGLLAGVGEEIVRRRRNVIAAGKSNKQEGVNEGHINGQEQSGEVNARAREVTFVARQCGRRGHGRVRGPVPGRGPGAPRRRG